MSDDEEHELLKDTTARTTALKEQFELAKSVRDDLAQQVREWIAAGQKLNEELVANTATTNTILARWDAIVEDLQTKLGRR